MNKVKEARKALGLNQMEMAGALGVTQSAISKMENGVRPISVRTCLALDALQAKKRKANRRSVNA